MWLCPARRKNESKTNLYCFLIASFAALGFFVFQRVQAQTALTTISGKFYRLEILAANGQNGIANLSSNSSINDFGTVAFTSSNGLYTSDGRNPIRNIFFSPTFSRTQINNQNQIIAQRFEFGSLRISRFDATLPNPSETLIATNVNGTDFTQINNPAINNFNQAVFSAVQGPNAQLVTGTFGAYNRQNIPSTSFNDLVPVVANDGSVLTRVGINSTPASQAIRLYTNYNLTGTPITIASVGTDFTRLGSRPGMSDDGTVLVFYGETPNGVNPAIPGIFASFVVGGTRRTVRIARRQVEISTMPGVNSNSDGVCDAGETNCVDGELGLNVTGNPLFFGSFDSDARWSSPPRFSSSREY